MYRSPTPLRSRRAASPALALAAATALGSCGSAPAVPREPPRVDGPPAPAQVRDGLGADIDRQDSRRSLFANWDPFVDPEDRPVVYEWCAGTAPGRDDVLPWTSAGGALQATATGLDLGDGALLFASVRATDLGGNRSPASSSDGVRIGAEPATAHDPLGGPAGRPAGGATTTGDFFALERFGHSWTFARPVRCGRFANGDWWVIGPVEIVGIAPQSRAVDGRVRHGSMIDPDPRSGVQGYDSAMFAEHGAGRFDPALDVGLGVGPRQPLRLAPGHSLVSTTSHLEAGHLPQLESCAVLTCLAEAPPEDAFRPPYCGADKTCRWRAGALDLSRLQRLEAPAGAPFPEELASRFERPWLDHVSGWTGRYLHPRENMPDYGRDLADLVAQAALVLQLDHPEARKRSLAIHLVQLGIDLHGIVAAGGRFAPDGGSGAGRKFPVLFAGAVLHDDRLLRCARDQKPAFAEDAQTFFVAETAPGTWNHGHGGYGAADAGLAEWGNRHADDPRHDDKRWTADPYRRCCTANAWHGFVLAARMMGLREAWGHEPLFDYVDRYMQIETPKSWTRSWSPFAERMWDRYRGDF